MKKVIVIGAGPAGLTAANELLKNKFYDVWILEESNEIGGISKTINYKGNRMDIGGHRFFSKNPEILQYWKNIMPLQEENINDIKNHNLEVEENIMLLRNRVSRIYYSKKFFDYPITLKRETITNVGVKGTVKIICSYIKSLFFKRKEISLEDFYINRFGKVLYSMFFEKYTEKLWGRHPSQISADWGAQRVKGLSIITILKDIILKKCKKNNKSKVETSLIEEFWYPKYGPGQFWELLAQNIERQGGKILKNHKIIRVNIKNNKIISVICDVNGEEIELFADIFLSSMPLKDLVCSFKGEKIPVDVLRIAQGLPYLDFQTVGVLVKKLKIENKSGKDSNIIPDCWIYVQEPEVKMLRFQIFNNWSPYLVKDPQNTVWIGVEYTCIENDRYWNMSDKEFTNFATNELVKIGIIDEEDILDTHRVKVKKAYPAYFDTYSEIDTLIEYLNKFNNLFCIGRNGQHRYNNMDHSMLTAINAVSNIVNNIPDKDNIWNVNTEKTYHEEKDK